MFYFPDQFEGTSGEHRYPMQSSAPVLGNMLQSVVASALGLNGRVEAKPDELQRAIRIAADPQAKAEREKEQFIASELAKLSLSEDDLTEELEQLIEKKWTMSRVFTSESRAALDIRILRAASPIKPEIARNYAPHIDQRDEPLFNDFSLVGLEVSAEQGTVAFYQQVFAQLQEKLEESNANESQLLRAFFNHYLGKYSQVLASSKQLDLLDGTQYLGMVFGKSRSVSKSLEQLRGNGNERNYFVAVLLRINEVTLEKEKELHGLDKSSMEARVLIEERKALDGLYSSYINQLKALGNEEVKLTDLFKDNALSTVTLGHVGNAHISIRDIERQAAYAKMGYDWKSYLYNWFSNLTIDTSKGFTEGLYRKLQQEVGSLEGTSKFMRWAKAHPYKFASLVRNIKSSFDIVADRTFLDQLESSAKSFLYTQTLLDAKTKSIVEEPVEGPDELLFDAIFRFSQYLPAIVGALKGGVGGFMKKLEPVEHTNSGTDTTIHGYPVPTPDGKIQYVEIKNTKSATHSFVEQNALTLGSKLLSGLLGAGKGAMSALIAQRAHELVPEQQVAVAVSGIINSSSFNEAFNKLVAQQRDQLALRVTGKMISAYMAPGSVFEMIRNGVSEWATTFLEADAPTKMDMAVMQITLPIVSTMISWNVISLMMQAPFISLGLATAVAVALAGLTVVLIGKLWASAPEGEKRELTLADLTAEKKDKVLNDPLIKQALSQQAETIIASARQNTSYLRPAPESAVDGVFDSQGLMTKMDEAWSKLQNQTTTGLFAFFNEQMPLQNPKNDGCSDEEYHICYELMVKQWLQPKVEEMLVQGLIKLDKVPEAKESKDMGQAVADEIRNSLMKAQLPNVAMNPFLPSHS